MVLSGKVGSRLNLNRLVTSAFSAWSSALEKIDR
jgi:hypothetical protein